MLCVSDGWNQNSTDQGDGLCVAGDFELVSDCHGIGRSLLKEHSSDVPGGFVSEAEER